MTDNFSEDEFHNKADGFDNPTKLPDNSAQALRWQQANKSWWESTPMRYDWREEISADKGSKEYYQEIDTRFLEAARQYLPWTGKPFESLIPYANIKNSDVLEIGVGHGTHAQLISKNCHSFNGIDLTDSATSMTQERFKVFGLQGKIQQMDAEKMTFDDDSFDFIWSWGVIHHSSNTLQILQEMHRTLRPGGRSCVMIYFRSFWKYQFMDGFLKGVLRGDRRRHKSTHAVAQAATDGAIARYYTKAEWATLCKNLFEVEKFEIMGQKSDLLPLPAGRLKDSIERLIPGPISRFITNKLSAGSFLVVHMKKSD